VISGYFTGLSSSKKASPNTKVGSNARWLVSYNHIKIGAGEGGFDAYPTRQSVTSSAAIAPLDIAPITAALVIPIKDF